MAVFDVAGDESVVEDLLVMPSMQLLNLALLMGVVNEDDLRNTAVGGVLPKCEESEHWCAVGGA